MSFLKNGNKAKEELKKANTAAANKANNQQYPWRLKRPSAMEGGEYDSGYLTFLDGDLDEDGTLKLISYYEHTVKMPGGNWENFVCISDAEPCPICESGNNAAFVCAFSVIDHRGYTTKENIEIPHTVRLFPAKRTTVALLQKAAQKRGGLTGCTFEVTRTGDKEAAVGNQFDFETKTDLAVLQGAYTIKSKDKNGNFVDQPVAPLDYENVLPYLTRQELAQLGFGSTPVGAEPAGHLNQGGHPSGGKGHPTGGAPGNSGTSGFSHPQEVPFDPDQDL